MTYEDLFREHGVPLTEAEKHFIEESGRDQLVIRAPIISSLFSIKKHEQLVKKQVRLYIVMTVFLIAVGILQACVLWLVSSLQ